MHLIAEAEAPWAPSYQRSVSSYQAIKFPSKHFEVWSGYDWLRGEVQKQNYPKPLSTSFTTAIPCIPRTGPKTFFDSP